MFRGFLAILLLLLLIGVACAKVVKMETANPAAVYCISLGYKYKIIKTKNGEEGICIFNKNESCDAWDFLKGKCGQNRSICAKLGYDITTVSNGSKSFSREYAVCVPKNKSHFAGKGIPVSKLVNLTGKVFSAEVNLPTKTNESIKFSSVKSIDLPKSFDWRNYEGYNWLTPVKDQGNCGSCWAFATIGCLEAEIKINRGDPHFNTDLSEQDLVSCGVPRGFYPNDPNAGGCGGASTIDALAYIQSVGVTDELCFPYTASDSSCSLKCPWWQRRLWKIDSFGLIPNNRDLIKEYLIENGPIIAGFDWGAHYFDSNGIIRCSGSTDEYHAVVIVGYNDTGGYWIFKNSWGTGWGDNGYGKIGYGECSVENYTTYIILSKYKPEDIFAKSFVVHKGLSSGNIEDTYYRDYKSLLISDKCSSLSCSGISAMINFTLPKSNVKSMDLISYSTTASEDSGLHMYFWNLIGWEDLGTLPAQYPMPIKYTICSSKDECKQYTDFGHLYLSYYRPSCILCVNNSVAIDMLVLEAYIEKPPVVILKVEPTLIFSNENVTFNASGSYDPDGGYIQNYTWNFGDGNITTTAVPIIVHEYPNPGTYRVNLTVTDDDGSSNSTSVVLKVLLKGDVDNNGVIDLNDATCVAYMIFNKIPPSPVADFNGNGKVDIGDLSKIVYFLLGKISKL